MNRRRTFLLIVVAAIASCLLAQNVYAQSLGDIARQQREKNKQQAATTNQVLTNDDLSTPAHSADATSDESQKKKTAKAKSSATAEQSGKDEPMPLPVRMRRLIK